MGGIMSSKDGFLVRINSPSLSCAPCKNASQITGDLCEVGVFKGKSLILLSLLKRDTERLLGFDLFVEDHLETTQQNLLAFNAEKNVELHQGLTSDISLDILDERISSPLRFLHIDAGHEYHEVLEQLAIFTPYLNDHAIIAMDDYQDREFPGIEAAVLDFAEQDRPRRFVPFFAGGNKMFLCNASTSTFFQKLLLTTPNLKDKCRLSRVRDFNILIMRSKLPVVSESILAQLDAMTFPRRNSDEVSLNEQSALFSQLTFGSGSNFKTDDYLYLLIETIY
jgi:hypothetical protein